MARAFSASMSTTASGAGGIAASNSSPRSQLGWDLLESDDLAPSPSPDLLSSPSSSSSSSSSSAFSKFRPTARTYFSMVPYQRRLMLFGGFGEQKRYNDFWWYDVDGNRWSAINSSGDSPKPLYLHSASIIDTRMYVFGGSVGSDSNALYSFDVERLHWNKLETKNSITARYGHAAVVVGNEIIVVGGCKQNSEYFKDSYALDIRTNTWRRLPDVPVDLAYHSLIQYEGKVLLFGGYNGSTFVQHVYSLNLSSVRAWEPEKCSGSAPPPLCGAAVNYLAEDEQVMVFAGYTSKGHTNDLYRLNLRNNHWESIYVPSAVRPISRAYLQSSIIDHRFFVFGGYDGSRCVRDFRCIQLPSTSAGLARGLLVKEFDAREYSSQVMKNFALKNDKALDSTELEAFISALANGMHITERHQQQHGNAASSSVASSFDTTKLNDFMAMGFTMQQVFDCLDRMHKKNLDTRDAALVVHHLISGGDPSASGAASLASAAPFTKSGHAASNLNSSAIPPMTFARMHEELEKTKHELKELRNCRVCLDRAIDCLLLPCAHLCVCVSCASHLMSGKTGCPMCRTKISSTTKIYWT